MVRCKKLAGPVLGLLLTLPLAQGVGHAASSPEPGQSATVEIDPAGDRQEPKGPGRPTPGIRTYGKAASRLIGSRSRLDRPSATTGALADTQRGVGAVNKISGPAMAGGVTALAISPDGTTAVYIADQETVGRFELYSTPVDGSAAPTKISAGVVFGAGDEGVSNFQITPDSSQVVFLADASAGGGSDDIYSVPIDRSLAPVQLNTAAARPVTGFGITPNGTQAAFFGVDSTAGSGATELYGATIGVASSARQLSDVGQGNAQGDVLSADFSPDSARVVYAGDGGTDNVFQWYSVSIAAAGPGTDVQLSAALGSVNVDVSAISPDSSRVVYSGDDMQSGVSEVFSIPIGGGAKTKLNPSMAGAGAIAVEISPDGSRVGYLADQNTAGVIEVYSALIAGPGSGTRLNTPMSGTQLADTITISSDSTMVLYEADQDTAGTFELYNAPIDAGAGPSTLHALSPPDNAGFFTGLGTPIIGRRAVYPVIGATVDLFSVPYDGSGPFTQVNDNLAAGEALFNAFLPTHATRLLAYGIGPDTATVTEELHAAPIRPDLAPEQINVTAAAGALGVLGYEISSDENYGVYVQDQDTIGKPELYSRQLDSDADTVVNAADNCPFVSNPTQNPIRFGQLVDATSQSTFAWTTADDVRFVRGPLDGLDVLATDDSGTLVDVTSYSDPAVPGPGAGLYYLFAPDCPGRSYQTSAGAEPNRDLAAFP